MSNVEKVKIWLSNSISVKLFSIGVLILLLLIPKSMITGLVNERKERYREVEDEIAKLWSSKQLVGGPILSIPYKRYYKDDDEFKSRIDYAFFLPDELDINVEVTPEVRNRGIFKVIVYRSDITLKGNFSRPEFKFEHINEVDFYWDKARISLGIQDLRGLEKEAQLLWNGSRLALEPGTTCTDFLNSGINALIPENVNQDTFFPFQISFKLKGSEGLYFEPVGKSTHASMKSNWRDPSFQGDFLPDHEINEEGFTANWNIIHFNRNYPQHWLEGKERIKSAAFGVNLFQASGHYQKSDRTIKYAVLLIVLTFMVFFLVEVITKIRIHSFQYILVGLALCIFYLLLLSISEYWGFNLAYLCSSVLVVILVSWYSKTFFKHRGGAIQIVGTLSLLYGFMFFIINMEDYALLVGSLGILFILSMLMYLTRNINWYKSSEQSNDI